MMGDWFETKDAILRALDLWSIGRFATRRGHSDRGRFHYVCYHKKTSGCPFEVVAYHRAWADGWWEVIKVVNHQCEGLAGVVRGRAENRKRVRESLLPELLPLKTSSTKYVMETVSTALGGQMNYQAAHEFVAAGKLDFREEHIRQFDWLPAYFDAIEKQSPNTFIAKEWQVSENSQSRYVFKRCFIAPAELRESFTYMRNLFALDATFLTGYFKLTLKLAAGIDANHHYTLLAWGVTHGETNDNWKWFVQNLKKAYTDAPSQQLSIISDRVKGIEVAEGEMGDSVFRLICCWHLKENIRKLVGTKRFQDSNMEYLFWGMVHALNQQEFEHRMVELGKISAQAEAYLRNPELKKEMWSTAFMAGGATTRAGAFTSNAVEVINGKLKQRGIRNLPIVDMLKGIWDYVMVKRAENILAAANPMSGQFSNWAYIQLNCAREECAGMTVSYSDILNPWQASAIISSRVDQRYLLFQFF